MTSTVLALVGLPAAGKSTVAKHLEETYGFTWVRTRDIVRLLGAENSIADLQAKGLDLAQGSGAEAFVAKVLERCQTTGHIVLDSLRPVSHLKLLGSALGDRLRVIEVSAPRQMRQERLTLREGAQARIADRDDHPVEAEVAVVADHATFHIRNLNHLPHRIEQMLIMTMWSPPRPSLFDLLSICRDDTERQDWIARANAVQSFDRRGALSIGLLSH